MYADVTSWPIVRAGLLNTVLLSFLVIPFSSAWIIKDMNVGIVLILGFSTLAVLAILMAGWSSNNKYSVLGAIRSVAQNVAYEIPLLITVMSEQELHVHLVKTPDILATLPGGGVRVGFAAESHDLLQHATAKRARKGVPLLVGNIGPATFGLDDNALLLVDAQGAKELPHANKLTLARQLVAEIAKRLKVI